MEELIKALHVIQNECNKHGNCKDCPMSFEAGTCAIADIQPMNWKIKDVAKVISE